LRSCTSHLSADSGSRVDNAFTHSILHYKVYCCQRLFCKPPLPARSAVAPERLPVALFLGRAPDAHGLSHGARPSIVARLKLVNHILVARIVAVLAEFEAGLHVID